MAKTKVNTDIDEKKSCKHDKPWRGGGGMGSLYGLGIVGALFYFLQNSHNLTEIVVGIIKSLFWPAFLVFKALELLKI